MTLPRHDRRGRTGLLLAGLCAGYFMVLLDMTVVTVGLPAIRADLGGGIGGLQWTVDAYVVAFGALVLTMGSVSDRLGARRTFAAGCWLFALASAAAGTAPSLAALVAARVAQGVGGAALLPASLTLIARAFPEPARRTRAVGAYATITGCALAAGPLAGGVLVDAVGWRAIFFVNLPIAGLGTLLTGRLVAADPPGAARRIDVPGQLCAVAAPAALTFACIQGGHGGYDAPAVLAAGAVAVAAVALLVAVERRSAHPMLPPGLLRIPVVRGGLVSGALINFAMSGVLFVLPLAFEQARGWSALRAGLAFLPLTLPTAFNPVLTGRLVARVGARGPIAAGFVLATVGTAVAASAGVRGPYAIVAAGLASLGIGISLVLPSLVAAVIAASPPEHVGVASGALNASRQLGGVLAVALAGGLLAGGAGVGATPRALAAMAVATGLGAVLSARRPSALRSTVRAIP